MDVIECLDPNTRKLKNFLNTISDNMPLSIFLHSYPIIHNENDINVLRKINLSILINYMNQENEFKLSIQYPSYLSINDEGQVIKEDILWLKSEFFDVECALNQIIYTFPKLLIAKDLFYDFFNTIKNSLSEYE